MGLSRRRRAGKSTEEQQSQNFEDDYAQMKDANSGSGRRQRSGGCTLRKVPGHAVDELRCSSAIFQVWPSAYKNIKRRPAEKKFILEPNQNHRAEHRVAIADCQFDCGMQYSLNKKSRWNIKAQLDEQCRSSRDDLRDYNLFVSEIEWSPRGRYDPITRKLSTNVEYMRMAARELRARTTGRSKRSDKASFSSRVAEAQHDRHLVTAGGRLGRVNRESLLRAFEMPPSDFADAEAMRSECRSRKNFNVEIRQPLTPVARRIPHSDVIDCSHFYRRQRQRPSCRQEALREDDICDFASADYESDEESDFEEETFDDSNVKHPSSGFTLFDAMRVKDSTRSTSMCGLVTPTPESHDTDDQKDWIVVCDDDVITDNERKLPAAMSNDVDSLLSERRLVLRVNSHLAAPERLDRLFAGTEALHMSDAEPRKFAVLLQDNLSESVVFEVISDDGEEAKMAMRHIVISDDSESMSHRRATAAKIVAMPDPFEFLRSLVSSATRSSVAPAIYQPQHGRVPAGWCRTEIWSEADARLAALRSLPMFDASVTSALKKASPVCQGGGQLECGICNKLLRANPSTEFSKRSTALGVCGHRFCNPCWVHHVTASLSAGFIRVECPSSGCSTVVDAAALLWFCPQRLLPALASAALRAWQRRLPTSRFCPLPRCGRLLVSVDEQRGKNAMCSCWTSVCLACGQEPHWPVDCRTADRYLREMAVRGYGNLRARDLFAVTTVFGKRCPSCRIIVEKNQGCNHMRCACGHYFCWDCLAELSEDHKCEDQKAGYMHKKFYAEDDLLVPSSDRSLVYCAAIRTRRARQDGPRLLESHAHLAAQLLAAAGRSAACSSDQIVADAVMSSYLLEYTCVLLDANEADESLQATVQSVGDRIRHLLRDMRAELQLEGKGFVDVSDANQAAQVCDKLAELQRQLESECQGLHRILSEFEGQFRVE